MNDLKLLASVQHLGTAVQRALSRNEQLSSEEMDQLVDSLTLEVQQTIEALDRPGETPIGEDPFDYYTGLINGLTADIATLRQSDVMSDTRVQGLVDALSELTSRVEAIKLQTDLEDSTPGALMSVGAFGLGGETIHGTQDDEQAIAVSGFFSAFDPDGLELYPEEVMFLALQHRNPDYAARLAVGVNGTPYVRSKVEGVWLPTKKVFHNENIVGTVEMQGGAPSGAVIERGSNVNGEYVRFADGTQICTHMSSYPAINIGHGSVFRSGQYHWNFPAWFLGIPAVVTQELAGNGYSWCGLGAIASNNLQTSWIILHPQSSPISGQVKHIAVGRWR